MAKLFKNRSMAERQKGLAPILDERRIDLLKYQGRTDKVDSFDLSHNAYNLTYEKPVVEEVKETVEPVVVTETTNNVDAELVAEMIKKVDDSYNTKKKQKKESITAKLLKKYKDTPKMSRKEMLCDYSITAEGLAANGISESTVDFLLK